MLALLPRMTESHVLVGPKVHPTLLHTDLALTTRLEKKTTQAKASQGKAWQGKLWQGKAWHGKQKRQQLVDP